MPTERGKHKYRLAPYFQFLDELRESGKTNMFGAAPYLQARFPELDDDRAYEILAEWMRRFGEAK